MNNLSTFLVYLISGLITVPFFSTYLVYFLSKKIHHHQWRAIHQAVHYTTLLYIIAVHIIVQLLFNYSLVWLIILLHLFILMIVIIYQRRKYTDINMVLGFKLLWRISFLIFFVSYVILIVYGMIKYIWLM